MSLNRGEWIFLARVHGINADRMRLRTIKKRMSRLARGWSLTGKRLANGDVA